MREQCPIIKPVVAITTGIYLVAITPKGVNHFQTFGLKITPFRVTI